MAVTAPDSYQVAKLLATLPMQLARYFCTGSQDQDTWGHYALATSRYTHFTSPIRRYPDVLVHRLVAAALEAGFGGRANASGFNSDGNKSTVDEGGGESSIGANKGGKRKGGKKNKGSGEGNGIGGGGGRSPSNAAIAAAALRWGIPTTQQLHASAEHCNERKLAAKSVQDGSMHAYLCAFLKRRPACVSGIVRAVGRKFLCVFVPTYGMEVRVPLEGLRWLAVSQEEAKEKGAAPLSVTITFDANSTSAGPEAGVEAGTRAGGIAAALETAGSESAPRADRKKAMRNVRGIRGRFLNTSEEEEEALEAIATAAAPDPPSSKRGSGSARGGAPDDPFGCGTPPCVLPATLRPIDRVCLLLGARFPERSRPEVTAFLLARNPMHAPPSE